MDLDETWQVGLRPERTKSCTFTAKSHYGFRRKREKMGRRGFFCDGNDCHFSWIDFCQTFHETCPGGGSQHVVSHSRKVSIKGSNFPKNRLFRVLYGTLFVTRLWVTGNLLLCLHCFRPLVDIPQICPTWVTFAEGCTVFQLSTSERLPVPRYQQWRNVDTYISFKHTRQWAQRSDRRFALVHYTNAHFLVVLCNSPHG